MKDLTVYENLKPPLYLKESANDPKIEKVLKDIKINKLSQKKVSALSGGKKQRVAIEREFLDQKLLLQMNQLLP